MKLAEPPRNANPLVQSMKHEAAMNLAKAVQTFRAEQKRKNDPDAEPKSLKERVIAKSAPYVPASEEDVQMEGISSPEEGVDRAIELSAISTPAPKKQNVFAGMSGAELRKAFIMSEVLGKPKGRR